MTIPTIEVCAHCERATCALGIWRCEQPGQTMLVAVNQGPKK